MPKKALFVLCLLVCFSRVTFASDVNNLLAEGKGAYKRGENQKAVYYFSKAILLDNERGEIFLHSAKAWVELGDYQQAINDLDECIRLDPTGIEGYCMRSYILQMQGDHQKAIFDINILLNSYPNNAPLYYVRAFIFEQAGDFDKAIADYTQALKLNKSVPGKRKKDDLLNFADLSDMPFFDKKGAALYFCRAMAQSKKGNFIQAKKDFKKAAQLNNNFIDDLPEGIVDAEAESA